MKKIILIIIDPSVDSDILRDRIKSLGPNYTFWGSHWFVKTSHTVKEVYDKITASDFETMSILVMELPGGLKPHSHGYYYGRMNTSLWDWLKDE